MSGFIERMGKPVATEEQLVSRRESAELFAGEDGVEFLNSIPHKASHELLRIALGDPYTHIKDAVADELTIRLNVLDEIIAERCQQATDKT